MAERNVADLTAGQDSEAASAVLAAEVGGNARKFTGSQFAGTGTYSPETAASGIRRKYSIPDVSTSGLTASGKQDTDRPVPAITNLSIYQIVKVSYQCSIAVTGTVNILGYDGSNDGNWFFNSDGTSSYSLALPNDTDKHELTFVRTLTGLDAGNLGLRYFPQSGISDTSVQIDFSDASVELISQLPLTQSEIQA